MNSIETPRLDTVEEKYAKCLNRFLSAKHELLELTQQLEQDLNYFGDYIESKELFEDKQHATSIYYIVRQVGEVNE